jgi:acetate kinase
LTTRHIKAQEQAYTFAMRTILAVNSGSSSLKVSLLKVQDGGKDKTVDRILIASAEQLGQEGASIEIKTDKQYSNAQSKDVSSTGEEKKSEDGARAKTSKEHEPKWDIEHADQQNMTHITALRHVLDKLNALVYVDKESGQTTKLKDSIIASGHRVVHGGKYFNESVIVNDRELENIKELRKLAPL